MRKYLKWSSYLLLICLGLSKVQAQLVVNGGTLTISNNAFISVQGNLTSNVDIQGPGKIIMSGSTAQQLNTNGFAIPNLEINTTGEVQLVGNSKVSTNLNFVAGKIKTGNFDLVLDNAATTTGQGATKFVWTNGTGQLKKVLTTNVTNYEFPLGENGNYRPAYLTTTAASFAAANVGVRALTGISPNTPPKIASSINAYWSVTRTGITGGTTRLSGQYTDADVMGTEANLAGYYHNGTDWSSTSETHDAAINRISALLTGPTGEISGMNKFIAAGARAFLQGAYTAGSGLMSDGLRTLPAGVFPLADPYRTAPYSTSFVHVNNSGAETINASVLATQAPVDNSIVDWVFLELRNTNASPGNAVLQTRSALVQRDGDIVDIDGVSPVTFNNITNGTYAVAVRHRNHLGLSINPSTSGKNLTEAKSLAYSTNVVDFRTAPQTQLFGTAANHTTAAHPTLTTVNVLWGGNANSNLNSRYLGGANDKDVILAALSNNAANFLNNVYHPADLNLNRIVRFNGGANDKDFLLSTVLGLNPAVSRLQALPN